MNFFTHREYFRTYRLSPAQYGEILIAQAFRGEKRRDTHPCFDVRARPDDVRTVLGAVGTDEQSPLWPRTEDEVRIKVRSKLDRTPAGVAILVHDAHVNGIGLHFKAMTHLAVVIVDPGSKVGTGRAEPGRILDAWLLTRDAAERLREKQGEYHFIQVSQLRDARQADGVISITSVVAAAAELPLQWADTVSVDSDVIRKTPGVCGGSACVGNTRIPVWLLSRFRASGMTDEQLLEAYPSLTKRGLAAAWEYAVQNPGEIAADVARQERRREKKERASA